MTVHRTSQVGSRFRPRALFAVFAVSAVVLAALVAWPYGFGWTGGRVLYVDPDGCDWRTGTSAARPLRTIQRAADLVRPGDVVKIMPGIYQERIHLGRGGTKDRRVVFEATVPGSVLISWAHPFPRAPATVWAPCGDGIYSTRTKWPIYRIACDGQTLFRVPWGGLQELRRLTERADAFGAFCYADGELFVFLQGDAHPADSRLVTHRLVPEPREWGEFKSANCWVAADHLELSGLRFEFGIGAGVLLWNAEDVVIRDCAFFEATFGIQCAAGIKPSREVLIERCVYHNYPQYDWRQRWLSWDEVYAAYSSSTFVCAIDDGTVVRDCLVAHAGDALRLTGRAASQGRGVVATRNWLVFGTDDAIELDGPGCNVTFARNLVLNFHESLGVSPVTEGPTRIEENLFLHPSVGGNGAQVKLLGNRSPPNSETIRNVEICSNYFFGNWLCWWGVTPVRDVRVHGNVFLVRHQTDPPWPPGVTEWSNKVGVLGESEIAATAQEALQKIRRQVSDGTGLHQLAILEAELLGRRPGPSWWDHDGHPATRQVGKMLGAR